MRILFGVECILIWTGYNSAFIHSTAEHSTTRHDTTRHKTTFCLITPSTHFPSYKSYY